MSSRTTSEAVITTSTLLFRYNFANYLLSGDGRSHLHPQSIERSFGGEFLDDSDRRIEYQNDPEQRVYWTPDDQDCQRQNADDGVEPREDVGSKNLADRSPLSVGKRIPLTCSPAVGDLGIRQSPASRGPQVWRRRGANGHAEPVPRRPSRETPRAKNAIFVYETEFRDTRLPAPTRRSRGPRSNRDFMIATAVPMTEGLTRTPKARRVRGGWTAALVLAVVALMAGVIRPASAASGSPPTECD